MNNDVAPPRNLRELFTGFLSIGARSFGGVMPWAYRVMVEDIYSQGYYMLKSKYRYLRFSYACFLIGFVAAAIELTITVIFD